MAIIDSVKLPDNSTYDVADNYSGYAKKVAGATTDDLASLTATGDLADSGKKLSDLALKNNLEHENLLDNPFFILNTRDAASYTGTVYGVDRWKGLSSVTTITPNSNGISVTRPSGDYWVLQQKIETPITENTLTVSIKHENGISAFTFTNGFDNSSQYDADVYVWLWSNGVSRAVYVGIIGNSLQIRAVKLEIGSVSTIHLDVPRPYALELARCQTSTADPSDTQANKGNLTKYSDLASLNLTGTKNTTGTTITAGTYFYLNGKYCRATQDILNNADFTENTNYNGTTVHGSLSHKNATGTYGSAIYVKRLAGDLVSFRINLGGSNNIASGTLLGTIPTELRPLETTTFNVYVDTGIFGLITIYSDGSIYYTGAVPALYFYGAGVYSLA